MGCPSKAEWDKLWDNPRNNTIEPLPEALEYQALRLGGGIGESGIDFLPITTRIQTASSDGGRFHFPVALQAVTDSIQHLHRRTGRESIHWEPLFPDRFSPSSATGSITPTARPATPSARGPFSFMQRGCRKAKAARRRLSRSFREAFAKREITSSSWPQQP